MDEKLILQSTITAEWQGLLQAAQKQCSNTLSEELESYLVFLLTRFTQRPDIASSTMALEYLESLGQLKTQRKQTLQEVGDQCLLLTGLFPGRAQRRRVRISYYVNLGKSAYTQLASLVPASLNSLYTSLDQEFVPLMDTLQAMHETKETSAFLDPLQAQELWADTGSQHARDTLRRSTQTGSVFIFGSPSQTKH